MFNWIKQKQEPNIFFLKEIYFKYKYRTSVTCKDGVTWTGFILLSETGKKHQIYYWTDFKTLNIRQWKTVIPERIFFKQPSQSCLLIPLILEDFRTSQAVSLDHFSPLSPFTAEWFRLVPWLFIFGYWVVWVLYIFSILTLYQVYDLQVFYFFFIEI